MRSRVSSALRFCGRAERRLTLPRAARVLWLAAACFGMTGPEASTRHEAPNRRYHARPARRARARVAHARVRLEALAAPGQQGGRRADLPLARTRPTRRGAARGHAPRPAAH